MAGKRPVAGTAGIALLIATQLTLLGLLWSVGIIAPDFFPIHLGALLISRGETPYGPAATGLLIELWSAPEPFPRAGIAYPLPVLLLALPLARLPFALAAALWNVAGLLMLSRIEQLRAGSLLPALLFWPLFWSLVIGQATLLWCGLIALLLPALSRPAAGHYPPATGRRPLPITHPAIAGLSLALLPLKPQTGLLFALAGAWLAWRHERRALFWAAGWAAGLAGLAWLIAPHWLNDWLNQLAVYRAAVRPISMWPWGLLLLAACWRTPWWSRLAIIQVFLFPLVRQQYGIDPYSLLPLLFCWLSIGGRIALAGIACSWIWPLLVLAGAGNLAAETTLILPLILAGAWHSWRQGDKVTG